MATEQITATMQRELATLAECGATLGELLDRLDEESSALGESGFSDDQHEELQVYCWALCKEQSGALLLGQARVWGYLDDDIGA